MSNKDSKKEKSVFGNREDRCSYGRDWSWTDKGWGGSSRQSKRNKGHDSSLIEDSINASSSLKPHIINRERDFLYLAHDLIEDLGFADFTMDKLTKASPYSKGTIYNHFVSKEDVVASLALQFVKDIYELFSLANSYDGNTREKALAIHVAYHKYTTSSPTLFMCFLTSCTKAIQEKAHPLRTQRFREVQEEINQLVQGAFNTAIEDETLAKDISSDIETAVFSHWSLAFGNNALITLISSNDDRFNENLIPMIVKGLNWHMDGMGWEPSSKDFDYYKSAQDIASWLDAIRQQRSQPFFMNLMSK